jgi:hypothetical protein
VTCAKNSLSSPPAITVGIFKFRSSTSYCVMYEHRNVANLSTGLAGWGLLSGSPLHKNFFNWVVRETENCNFHENLGSRGALRASPPFLTAASSGESILSYLLVMLHRLNCVTQFLRSVSWPSGLTVSSISVGVRNLVRDDNWDGVSQAHGKERRNRVGS